MIILYIYEMMILGRLDLLLASLVIKNSRWFSAWMGSVYIYDLCSYGGFALLLASLRNKK